MTTLAPKIIFVKMIYTYKDTGRQVTGWRAEVDRHVGPILIIEYEDDEILFWMIDQMLPRARITIPDVWPEKRIEFSIDPRSRVKT